ncbi:MAG: NAD-dependent epimerase/dehydratase family protein [Actinobacteria bacterium]|nr:NAD-dependent epimerase/dehydratase family protein [Actinomycetota bacterium]
MKVLVLGGTRFMGRYVSSTFLAAGTQVTVANRGTRDGDPDTTNVICDRSIPGSLEIFKDSQFDVVIDFSAYSSAWVEEAGKFFANKIKKYIFISTSAVYSSSNTFPITEDFPTGPPHLFAPYALEKMRSEAFLRDFSKEGFFQTTSCRLPFVLGPENYEDRESFVFSRLLTGKPILLENDGKALHSFIFAGDVADAILAIAKADKSVDGEAFNIAMPQGTTSRGFVEIAAKICGKSPNIISYNPKDFGISVEDFNLRNVTFPFPDNSAFLSSDKIKAVLRFVPEYTLEKSLARYLQWWTDQGDLAPKEYDLENRILSAL